MHVAHGQAGAARATRQRQQVGGALARRCCSAHGTRRDEPWQPSRGGNRDTSVLRTRPHATRANPPRLPYLTPFVLRARTQGPKRNRRKKNARCAGAQRLRKEKPARPYSAHRESPQMPRSDAPETDAAHMRAFRHCVTRRGATNSPLPRRRRRQSPTGGRLRRRRPPHVVFICRNEPTRRLAISNRAREGPKLPPRDRGVTSASEAGVQTGRRASAARVACRPRPTAKGHDKSADAAVCPDGLSAA
ncbi:unnamed protein product [Chondrus crispus]|uniref:Uncharacterized protein n=1 Tax=Chondrus crispus TaxID=2769 RepID=R7QQX3_CHOCR|nr:unnamed protein product [Chondrus crispus]CDF40892.1 unnamed protein product [Chondrus crispus]|eukprot:XP_005711186.1 unnamed protein product [Chondrus crispus]